MTVNQRIKILREKNNLTQLAFAEAIGISRANLAQVETGKQLPTLSQIMEIVTIFNVSYEYLLHGREITLQKSSSNIAKEPPLVYGVVHREDDVVHRKYIPLIPIDAVAGLIGDNATIREQDIKERYVIPDFQEVDFMVRVKGSSMYPKYNSGDIVACRLLRESAFIQWGKVYVLDTIEQGALVKRIRKGPSPEVLLAVSDNESYEPFEIPRSEVRALALVIGVVRLE